VSKENVLRSISQLSPLSPWTEIRHGDLACFLADNRVDFGFHCARCSDEISNFSCGDKFTVVCTEGSANICSPDTHVDANALRA